METFTIYLTLAKKIKGDEVGDIIEMQNMAIFTWSYKITFPRDLALDSTKIAEVNKGTAVRIAKEKGLRV